MTTKVEFSDAITVKLIGSMGSDETIARAAWVSTMGERAEENDTARVAGLINYLMKNRHGTPFEHNAMTMIVKAPIFVFREWHRHRVAWSYNELSGRYSQLQPLFYRPGGDRPIVNIGTSARPEFEFGTVEQQQMVQLGIETVSKIAYTWYEQMLASNIANEVARMVLPVNIYTAMYATCNLRSLMNYLSLRTNHPEATFPSRPMWEIAVAAQAAEGFFKEFYPITYEAFVNNGRVAP